MQEKSDSGKPRRQQILFCDIQIKVVISRRQIYVYHTDLLPLSRSLQVKFDSAVELTHIWFAINV